MVDLSFSPLGDQAVMIDFGDNIEREKIELILAWYDTLTSKPFPGLVEAVPAYTTLTIYYDPLVVGSQAPYETVKKILTGLKTTVLTAGVNSKRSIEIPVCYEHPFAPDLEYVANYNHLTVDDVIRLHSDRIYHVYFLGFSPGFPFLGEMSTKIVTPRRPSPRLKIPRGSVGIAGKQTGIYPQETPGGWQIIGRTPLSLFDVNDSPPTLLLPGDQVRFIPISTADYVRLEQK